jgi:hypothetical protein
MCQALDVVIAQDTIVDGHYRGGCLRPAVLGVLATGRQLEPGPLLLGTEMGQTCLMPDFKAVARFSWRLLGGDGNQGRLFGTHILLF